MPVGYLSFSCTFTSGYASDNAERVLRKDTTPLRFSFAMAAYNNIYNIMFFGLSRSPSPHSLPSKTQLRLTQT